LKVHAHKNKEGGTVVRKTAFLTSSLIITLLAIGQVKAVTITSFSQNATTVGRFEKFEITLTLSQTGYSNPYDPCVIDINVTFNEPGGTVSSIPAFFFQNYTVSGSNPERYISPTGPEQWKARFAPSKVGTYTFDITIRDANGTDIYTNYGNFVCEERGKKRIYRSRY
jgi:hypothetical protein